MSKEKVDWHLNKSVSLSVIILLLSNISISVWFASGLNNDVETLKLKPDLLTRVIILEEKTSEHGRIIAKMDATLDKFNTTLDRIDREQAKRTNLVYGKNKK